jgi:hypothetical protein
MKYIVSASIEVRETDQSAPLMVLGGVSMHVDESELAAPDELVRRVGIALARPQQVRQEPEAEETCGWCKRSVPVSEMNTLDWGGKGARICDRCCDESA